MSGFLNPLRTEWDLMSRLNVDSDLNIFNDRSVQIISPPSNIGSFSFMLEKKVDLGRLITKGATTIDVSEISPLPINQKRSVVVTNGRLYLSGKNENAFVKDLTVIGDLFIGNGGSNNEDFTISHIVFYDNSRILTQQEISYLQANGGIAPQSSHSIIIPSSLALTERTAFKADAAFVAKHPQFSVGDNVFFDTVEQYNYAKVAPITANHAKAINFTDDELGVINPSTQTVKKDFYNKQTLKPLGLKFDSSLSQNARLNPLPNPINLTAPPYAIYLDIVVNDAGVLTGFVNHALTAPPRFQIATNNNGGVDYSLWLYVYGSTGFNIIQILNLEYNKRQKISLNINTFLFLGTGTVPFDNGDIDGVKNGFPLVSSDLTCSRANDIPSDPISISFTELNICSNQAGSSNTGAIINDIQWYDRALTVSEQIQLFKEGGVLSGIVERVSPQKNFDGEVITELGNVLPMENFTNSEADKFFLEAETGFPELKEAFQVRTGFSFTKSVVSASQMTIAILAEDDIAAITDIITGLPANTAYYNGVLSGNIVDYLNTNTISLVTFQFNSPFTGNINFVHTGDDYSLMMLSIKEDQESRKEILSRFNNSLLANSIDQYQSYHLFNIGQFENNVDNIDLSGNSNDLPITGFIDLADVPNYLTDINDLR